MDFWKEKFKYIFVQHKYKTTWRAIATFMAAVVVFVTTYGMILPAITMETEIAEEMPGIQLEHNAEPEQMVEDDLSDGLTGGSGIPETSVESQDSEGITGQDSTVADDGKDEAPGAALLTAKTEKSEAVISNVSGEMFPGGMSLSIKELKKEGFEYTAYRPIAQNKASSDEEEPGDWSDCDTRIFDLRFIDKEGYEVILPQEMKAEIKFTEPMTADLYKVVLLTDERDDLTGDADTIDVDSVKSRNNHTLELIRDGYNAVIGFRFKAEEISLVALLTKQAEAEPEIETTEEPEEEITADETVTETETETELAEETAEESETDMEPAEETTTESETEEESTEDTEENPETDEVQEQDEESSKDAATEEETIEEKTAGEQEEETELDEAVEPDEETDSEEALDTEDQKDDTVAATEEAVEDQDLSADVVDEETDKADNEESDIEETEAEEQEVEATEDPIEDHEAEESEDSEDEQEAEGSEDSEDEQEAEGSEDSVDEKEAEESEDTDEEQEVEEAEDSTDDQDSEENDRAEEESEDNVRTEQLEENLSLTYPAQIFDKYTDNVHVYVNAPEGAFPADTDMRIEDVVDQDTIDKIEEAIDENVSKVIAVNISFFAPDDKETEIQPLIPVQVVIKAEESAESEEIKVVHVDDNGVAKEVGTVNLTEPGESDGGTQATIIEPRTNAEVDDTVNVETGSDEAVEEPGTVSEEESAAESTTEPAEESSMEESETTEVSDDTSAVNTTMSGRRNVRLSVANRTPALNVETNESPRESETTFEELISGNEEGSELVTFYAGGFSIYALVYTVDFEYSVNGKTYQFSLPGGGFVSLTDLVEVLGIIGDTNSGNSEDENVPDNNANEAPEECGVTSDTNMALTLDGLEVSEATRKFVADVASVEFSSPNLVDISKVEADTTVSQIKESRRLVCEYSVDLTAEQIETINARTVELGDWALISLQPFTSEETLTVTMKNGNQFVVRVTDYQISTNVLTADGKNYKITVTYDDDAEIPAGTKLVAEEIMPGTDEYLQHLGKTWAEVNKEYLKQEEKKKNNIGGLDEYEDIRLVNLDDARFFNISLIYNKEEIEPKAPVQVDIQYVDGLETSVAAEEAVIGAAHFIENTENKDAEDGAVELIQYVDGLETNVAAEEAAIGATQFIDNTENKDAEDGAVELIQAVDTVCDEDGKYVEFSYEQGSFSDIGTYVGQETTDDANASVAGRIAYPKLSAMLRASSTPLKDELGEPVASKTLEDNEDGTYTLSLSVTGAAKKKDEQPKANVLFVMDRSSSMSNSSNDIYLPYSGEYQSGTTYYGTNNGTNYFALNYTNGQYTYTDGYWPYTTHRYTGTVYTRISRLKAEQDAMSILFMDLLENNKDENGSYTKDNVEISVISFADDRGKMNEGTEYPNGGSVNGWTSSDYAGLMTVVNNISTPSGTNWQDALMYAKEVADAKKETQPNEPVFVIFLTDGEPTAIYGESGGAHHYNNHGGGFIEAYTPARPYAKAIVDAGYGFYSIFTFNPGEEQTRYLKRLVHYAYTGYDVSNTTSGDFSYLDSSQYVDSYFYNADSPENLASAFDDILSAITTTIAHGNVSIVDGLTTDAMTSTLIDGKANGFIYKVTDENNNVLYTVTATGDADNPSVTFKINGTTYSGSQVVQKEAANGKKYYSVKVDNIEYKMTLADFVDTGEGNEETKELTWDLSPIGTLADKCTYSIEFVVWPNQEAYDYVAALNNGLMEWDKTAQTPVYDKDGNLKYYKNGVENYPSIVLDPDTEVYSVLTNTKQELEYSIISTTNGEQTVEGPYKVPLDTPDPMILKSTASALEKVWNINRDPSILYKYLYETKDENNNPVPFNIGFVIEQDGAEYKQVDLPGKATITEDGVSYDWSAYDAKDLVEYNGKKFSKRWSQEFSIPTGLMLSTAQMDARSLDKSQYTSYFFNGTVYYVLENGHDFKISEPSVGYEFDFESPTYHPMLVDGVLMDVKFSTEGETRYISSMEALETDTGTGQSALNVFNTLRGYINIKKKVVDYDGTTELTTDDTEFTFKVELTNALPVFEGDHIPWYGINGLYYHDAEADDNFYQAEYIDGKLQVTTEEGGPYEGIGTAFNPDYAGEQTITYLVDGQEVSVTICGNQMTPGDGNDTDGYKKITGIAKITQDETLYIANVPVNTHYAVQEIAKEGYQLVGIERQVGTNTSATVPVNINAEINGEIVQNTETLIKYTNKCLVTDINIQKINEKGKGLEGAVFRLKKVNGFEEIDASTIESVSGLRKVTKEVNGKTVEYTSAFETTDGIQTIHGLPDGTYKLEEVYVPAGYITTVKYVQFDIENRVMKNVTTDTEDMSTIDFTVAGENSLALLKIKNIAGAALPNTGGPGTRLFTILGSIMILGAGILLWRRRRVI